ncbi:MULTISPECIES: ICP22 family protein [Streptomyces]|uniref:hypothetical protein n=1 Tax=Streptomyces TaxID=1883 RepID=UPI000BCA4B9C|nr:MULTISPECIES: hypothetical protein [Streptomyces]MDX2554961.1 hypothetical protein [Streptomyces stelliscabiei]MDX2611188.1 hypothetical protein [Streptomyces stelliscabiei]MDX2638927.1 hypothetical protein [Streptomyces stelliscabiei]MDX2662240.1 hypothetical protein [Streptomyces stelliscabiei]MDX2712715.1 hypothetical protein [Streptomyces stelliscabiei]
MGTASGEERPAEGADQRPDGTPRADAGDGSAGASGNGGGTPPGESTADRDAASATDDGAAEGSGADSGEDSGAHSGDEPGDDPGTGSEDGEPGSDSGDDPGADSGDDDPGAGSGEAPGADPAGPADGAAPEPDATPDERRLSTLSTTLLGLFLLADVVFVCGALVTLWPAVLATVEPGAEPTVTARWSPFGLGDWSLTADAAMLLAVVVCSALGSFVHAATSFATYVGNRRLYASWLWWYLLRAGIGVALALLVYLLLRGGLFAGSSGTGATNPYGFSGIAGLCGLFSKQATDKLREICDTLLTTTGDGDRDRRDGLAAGRNGDPGAS